MKVIDPIAITDAMVASHSVVETDVVDGPEWSPGATYSAGQRVRISAIHRSYVSSSDGNQGNDPRTSPLKWAPDGHTNPWRMLRTDSDVPTVAPSPLVLTLAPGQRFTALAAVRIKGDRIRGTTSTGYSSGWRPLRYRPTRTWSDYFYGRFIQREMELLLNMPLAGAQTLTIEIERDTGDVECGPLIVGRPVDLGEVNLGATVGIRDFGEIKRDKFGYATLTPGRAVPSTTQIATFNRHMAEQVRRTLTGLRGRVGFYFGIDDATHPYFESLAALALLQDWKINLDQNVEANVSLQMEGY